MNLGIAVIIRLVVIFCAACLFVWPTFAWSQTAPEVASPAPASTSTVKVIAAPGVGIRARLNDVDRNLALLRQAANPHTAALTLSALSGIRFSSARNAIIVGSRTGAYPKGLVYDTVFQNNLRFLASLERRSLDQPQAASATVNGDAGFRILGFAAKLRRSFVMRVYIGSQQQCSGVLVAKDAVLTALHCQCEMFPGITSVQYTDAAGADKNVPVSHVYSAIDDSSDWQRLCRTNREGKSPFANPPVQATQKGHDIVLLKLGQAIDGHSAAPLMIYATAEQIHKAHAGLIAGFGLQNPNDPDSYVMTGDPPATVVLLASQKVCPNCTDQELPAGSTVRFGGTNATGRDSCDGDSGGPIFLMDKQAATASLSNGTFTLQTLTTRVTLVLAGLTSRNIDERGGCGNGAIYELMDSKDIIALLDKHDVSMINEATFDPL